MRRSCFARAAAVGAALAVFGALSAAKPAAVDAHALSRRRRKSHRSRRRRRARSKVRPASRRLAPGRWRPEVAAALERVLEEYGFDRPGYDPKKPPVAVFALDDVSITQNAGEAVFNRLVTRSEFSFSEEFWKLVPTQFGRARIRAGWEGFRELPRGVWPRDPYYRLYRKGFLKCYQDLCRQFGGRRCSTWLVKLLVGFPEGELRRYARRTIEIEMERPVSVEKVGETPEDPKPVSIRAGLRRIPEMRELYAQLKKRGIDVWVVSSSNHWAALIMAEEYGIGVSRVLGIRPQVTGGAISSRVLIPITRGSGNAEAITMFIGRSPVLIVGGEEDEAMLGYGRGVRIQIVDPAAASPAMKKKRWLVQPRFSPVRAPQQLLSTAAP